MNRIASSLLAATAFIALPSISIAQEEPQNQPPTETAPTAETAPAALDEAEALAVDAALYAKAYGVSEAEAARRLLIMYGTAEQIAQIEQEYAATLSGVYIDNGRDFGVKVVLTGDVAPPPKRLVRKATRTARKADRAARRLARGKAGISDAQVEVAENALATETVGEARFEARGKGRRAERRQRLRDRIAMLRQKIPQLDMAIDDEETGETVIYLKADDGAAKAAAEAALGNPVRVVVIPGGIQQTAVRGGSLLVRASDNGLHCMTGFSAKNSSTGALGVLTAGHCLNGTALKYTDRDGTAVAISPAAGMSQNNATMDIGFLSSTAAVAEFYADSGAARNLTTFRSRAGTNAGNGTVKGSFVCHLGQTSPTNATLVQSCGEVTSTAGAGANGGNTFVIVSNTQSGAGTTVTSGRGTLYCVPGDSGGPFFATTTAFGIQSACAWNDAAKTITNIVVYTSVDYASSIGASLVYK